MNPEKYERAKEIEKELSYIDKLLEKIDFGADTEPNFDLKIRIGTDFEFEIYPKRSTSISQGCVVYIRRLLSEEREIFIKKVYRKLQAKRNKLLKEFKSL